MRIPFESSDRSTQVVGKLKAGEQTRWEIEEPLRKVFITAK